jgi:hypothetical protein
MDKEKLKMTIVLETGDGELWGRIESPEGIEPSFLHTTVGADMKEVTENLKGLVADFIAEDGKDSDYWTAIKADEIEYDYQYDLTALFETYPELNISKVAERAGINPGLMRQYKSAVKHPSETQARKIQMAIHSLAEDLLKVHLV